VFYRFYWYPETISWLQSLGLGEVLEARSGRSYALDKNTKVTFIGASGQNSIIVVESGKEVLVNVNDSLHSEPDWLIDLYIRLLKRRWPEIDTVFCGFGGASYYPNALHSPAKNDHAVARLREQLFIHKFCRIVHGLAPRLAIPFAADFVLLAPHQRWVNEVRFSEKTALHIIRIKSAPMVIGRLKSKLRSRFGHNNNNDDDLISSSHWLTGNVDAIRNACGLPEV
jgi:hypothetical protein